MHSSPILQIKLSIISIIFIAFANSLYAQDTDVFIGPEPDYMAPMRFPQRSFDRGIEGFVNINVMIDTQGEPFDAVIQSTEVGSGFEREALRVINRSRFKPATLNGEAVESSASYRYHFQIDGLNGAKRSFVDKFESFIEAFNSETKIEGAIQTKFDELVEHGSKSFYENAYLNLARYYYATLYGTTLSQMNYLNEALFFSASGVNTDNFLSEDLEREARSALFSLQVLNNHLYEAVINYEIMEKNNDIVGINLHKPLYDRLLTIKKDETAYQVEGSLNTYGSWKVSLFKSQFYIDSIQGTINELKLHCTKKYVFISFDPDLDFVIPDTWGDCLLVMIGNSNTSFRLVQY